MGEFHPPLSYNELKCMNKLNAVYQKDFYSWIMQNAELIRQGKFSEVDSDNLIEELESMGRSEKRELVSRLAVLIAHLLKWTFQSEKRSYSWECTIEEQRHQVIYVLEDSPSLKHQLEERLIVVYQRSVVIAAKETGIKKERFPKESPFSLTQIMDKDFYPEAQSLRN